MFTWLRDLFAPRPSPGGAGVLPRRVRASYDAAQVSTEGSKHWLQADALSARQANSLEVRKTLRERARYEVANNSYAKGIILTLANNLVGMGGPRLQVATPSQEINRAIEARWAAWAEAIRLADCLRTMVQSKKTDGEAVGLLTNNPLLNDAVQLDLRLVECDQLSTPWLPWDDPLACDGIKFDAHGNPVEYHLLRYHPGDWYAGPTDFTRLSPTSVLHWFRADRPGQCRGIPEITPGLPLLAQLRRFTLATLDAAETAAHFAAVLKSQLDPSTDADQEASAWDEVEITRRMMVTLPPGYEMQQFRAEHPASSYEMFVWCLLREFCRSINVPLNIALGDSSKSNFSSARLDHLVYRQAVAVERDDCRVEVLEPLFSAWLNEAVMVPGYLPSGVGVDLPHVWHWPAWEPIDPAVEASTEETRLAAGTASLAEVAASHGQDWRALIRQRAEEEAFVLETRRALGLPEQAPADEARTEETASATD